MHYLRWLLGLLLGGLLLYAAARGLDWEAVLAALGAFPWPLLLPALALVLLSFLVRAYRWRLLFPPPDRIGVLPLFLVETTGTAVNSLSPVHVLAEPVQLFLLVSRFRRGPGTVLATLVAVRAIDLVVTMGVAAGGVLLLPALAALAPVVALGWAVVLLLFLLLGLAHLAGARLAWLRQRAFLQGYLRAWGGMARRGDRGTAVLATTLLQWALVSLALWLVAWGLEIDVTLPEMTVLFLLTLTFAGALPSLPGAIGPIQFTWVLLLGAVGASAEAAFTFSILVHLLIILVPLVIAGLTLGGLGVTWGEVRTARRGFREGVEASG